MASNSDRIMEKSRNFQIVYMQAAQTFVNIAQLRHYETGDFPATTLSHCRGAISLSPSLGSKEVVTISSACLESAAPTGVHRVHKNSFDVEGTVFQTF